MFQETCIVSCGILHPELQYLRDTGFLDAHKLRFVPPGLHAKPSELESHLVARLRQLRQDDPDCNIIVAYGKKCHVDVDRPDRRVDNILQEFGPGIARVQGEYGYDMLISYDDRQRLTDGREGKTLWFTLGWLKSWKTIYQRYFHLDRADANANFPGYYDRVIVLDTLGAADTIMAEEPEAILELFDWMGLEVEFHPISLDRFKGLLLDSLAELNQKRDAGL